MINPDRQALRRRLRAERNALPARARFAAAEAISEHLLDWPLWQQLGTRLAVAGYWAVSGELSLHALQSRVSRAPLQHVYHLPCIEADARLRFAPWRLGDPLQSNRFGIPEPDLEAASRLAPEALDAVLVPLTAFDRCGQRLGSGGGYYDRSFAFRQHASCSKPLLIGIAYAMQELPLIHAETWDVALDAVVTENGVIDCRVERARAGS